MEPMERAAAANKGSAGVAGANTLQFVQLDFSLSLEMLRVSRIND
jgi:hypothetical protein